MCLTQVLLFLGLCSLPSLDGFVSAHNQTALSKAVEVCSGQNISIKKCELKRKAFMCPHVSDLDRRSWEQAVPSADSPGTGRRPHTLAQAAPLKAPGAVMSSWPQQKACLQRRQNTQLERVPRTQGQRPCSVEQDYSSPGPSPSVHGGFSGTASGLAPLFQKFLMVRFPLL